MRLLGIACLLLTAVSRAAGASGALDRTYNEYGRLLSRYVTPQGVRYDAWRAAPADVRALANVIADLSRVDTKELTAAGRTGLYINTYNAEVLLIVLEGNPASSIKDLSRGLNPYEIFKRPVIDFEGRKISLEDLETRLRGESKDPRIHFAINCASRSCPPIARFPYWNELDTDLDRATRAFLEAPGNLEARRDGRSEKRGVRISTSKIFDWYAKDFGETGGVIAFIRKYAPPAVAREIESASGAVKLEFHDYDWTLNEAP